MHPALRPALVTAAAVALSSLATIGHAAEGGGSTYSAGVENFLTGAVPPPGFYLLGYGEYYTATKLKDKSGHDAGVPPDFKVQATAAVFRGIWSSSYALLGGTFIAEAIAPVLDLKVTAGGQTDHKSGLGDLVLGAGIAYHHSPALHSAIALDVVFPTARYDATALANLSRHYLSFQPLYTMSLVNPAGLNADFKAALTLNQKNKDTQYKSGNEIFVDYSAGWGLGNGWVLGAGGYLREQFSDDKLNGNTVANYRAHAFAIGPSLAYSNGKGWFVTAKWQDEVSVHNALQGSAFWVKAVIPF